MTERERLIELIIASVDGCAEYWAARIADYLIENGVRLPVTCFECVHWRKEIGDGWCSAFGCYCHNKNFYCADGERRENGKKELS